jgi:two-component system, NtrC family, response regulator AtoC
MDLRFRVLVADDEPAVAKYIVRLFDPAKYHAQFATSGTSCLDIVRRKGFVPDLFILDAGMPGMDGLETLRLLRKLQADVPVVMMCHQPNPTFVLQASEAGANDFLHKPVSPKDLARITDNLASQPRPVAKTAGESVRIEELGDGQFFLAASPAMRQIWQQVNTIAPTNVPVLMTGESGSGKEVVARLIHAHSTRASRQLLKVNCAALPADLLESELFGYEAGAFTGAMKAKPGKFDQCDKGTILLDEIGEMSPQLQAKLLHVLQDGQFSRLGSRANTQVDVRILAATNIDIEQAIVEKKFREDLYYRLNTFVIRVPPLRERRQEIPYLLSELTTRLAASYRLEPVEYSPRLIAASIDYSWPGNLRELGNFVKRYLIMRDEAAAVVDLESKASKARLTLVDLDQIEDSASEAGLKSAVRSMKDQTEIKMIREVLDQTNWNRRIAAERLQISYKALLYKIRQYNLEVSA